MDISYFQKINNTYQSKSKQETELWLINRDESRYLYDNIDKESCLKNNEPYEMLIIKGTNDYSKKIKALKSTPFNLGDYIQWDNQIWLITSIDTNDKVHCSGTMNLCTVALHWQKNDGAIVERWAYSEDFTKYDSGKISNGSLSIASNQYGITLPIDSETKKLKRDMRFAIDFDDAEIPDIYALSNKKVVLHNNTYFNRGGTMTLTMTFNAFDATRDCQVEFEDEFGNKKYVWICDYNHFPTKPYSDNNLFDLKAYIEGSDECYFEDLCYWEIVFKDKNDALISIDNITFEWLCNIVDKNGNAVKECIPNINGDEIELIVTDSMFLGEILTLQIVVNNVVLASKNINVLGGF